LELFPLQYLGQCVLLNSLWGVVSFCFVFLLFFSVKRVQR
jgi:hypothetical protein